MSLLLVCLGDTALDSKALTYNARSACAKLRADRRQPRHWQGNTVGTSSPSYRVFALRDISRGLPPFASRHSRSLLSGTVCTVRVQISTVIARLSGDSEDLLDDYRFWRERDSELKSLAVSDPK